MIIRILWAATTAWSTRALRTLADRKRGWNCRRERIMGHGSVIIGFTFRRSCRKTNRAKTGGAYEIQSLSARLITLLALTVATELTARNIVTSSSTLALPRWIFEGG